MTCKCSLCQRHDEYEAHLANVPEPAKAFFKRIYDDLNTTEFDRDWYKMSLEASEARYD